MTPTTPAGQMAPIRYGDWEIYPTDPLPPIPGWQQFAWTFTHKDYDGPEDSRHGYAPSLEAAQAEVDEREGDLPEGWQAAQAARCGCRGTDDLCPCQNKYAPWKYGLTTTEKCGDCGLLASSLLHRFCTREDCPARSAIILATQQRGGEEDHGSVASVGSADLVASPSRGTQVCAPPGGGVSKGHNND